MERELSVATIYGGLSAVSVSSSSSSSSSSSCDERYYFSIVTVITTMHNGVLSCLLTSPRGTVEQKLAGGAGSTVWITPSVPGRRVENENTHTHTHIHTHTYIIQHLLTSYIGTCVLLGGWLWWAATSYSLSHWTPNILAQGQLFSMGERWWWWPSTRFSLLGLLSIS